MDNTALTQIRALLARQQVLNQQQHKRLARRIHDEISQKLTLLALQVSLASSDNTPPTNWAAKCQDWARLAMELGQSMREITNELQPRILDQLGLTAALRWLAQSLSKDIRCVVLAPSEDISLPPFAANELFGICREIIADMLIPAGVVCVEIELEEKDGMARLHVRANDNGLGSELINEKTLDAIAIHERLLCLDGTAESSYSSDSGSEVTLSVPAAGHAALCAGR